MDATRLPTDLIFLDTETTGLDLNADIWEFAGFRRRPDGSQATLHLFIEHSAAKAARLPAEFAEDRAARYDDESAVTQFEASRLIDAFTGRRDGVRPVLVGSAPDFDAGLIRRMMRRAGRAPEWDHQLVGIVPLMIGYLGPKALDLPHESEHLSRACRVDPDQFERHTAMGDVEWVMAVWDRIVGGAA